MELEIQIVRDPCHDIPKQRVRVFGPGGGNIGRSPNNYWSLPDPKSYVSGQHCEVEFRDDAFWLRDTSRNGVFVNEAPVDEAVLEDGDVLGLGSCRLVFRLPGPTGHEPAAPTAGTDVEGP